MAKVEATMAGTVMQVLVAVGDKVDAGQDVVILESMKMEVPVQSEYSGVVKEIKVETGSFVSDGDVLIELS
ncbi:acetyl-CoA carboxylase biotin carboxyl carrier protein subunit [Thermoactinomyces intermedius]|jgi:acetyl-CoA carboxylase biotin carboxyl carrier protein|uniref:Acetyl-CoA carboxylase biotin carboxyl carrier protein subunit n=1 Tax=Thermoactinomyces intermedius TaxID=2024 RepID=A0A8I1A2A6_THEIN|nr:MULTISPECIES: acetyl-CoA carboxylase biotin carboxyl carrier protein subunit [Thermoactinomyces]MBA4547574.1 acetyl-CoA carboxylase biotin carboxyl carrier protein subunit [Thermoactinomyces intermedius]MBA4836214.1 acetyl-CoA carboxylase biotin carboxyl carrier protein subunit [Thermoactinomyces intermedius]MBH8594197.1 acetyl-CoA carboxylase biotin carboxyl carrier protein subunit [Thermoactinomyces intermedius]MBH8601033.1 acetyl-CoA carboxylase biotin carboxyl carrier protein subunit [Th